MDETKKPEPCGNEDCDICYPLPRWHTKRVIVIRREYFGTVKALTLEDARTQAEKSTRKSSYGQEVVEEYNAVVEPLDQESLEWYAEYGPEQCFHAVRARAAARPERFPRPVVCDWCGNHFRAIYNDESKDKQTQGDDCASHVYHKNDEWYVGGGYGSSSFDMSRLRFIANYPTQPLDPVCDQCINERIALGDLVDDPGD